MVGREPIRIGDVDGVAFFPTVEPYFILLLFFGAVAYVIYFLATLGSRRPDDNLPEFLSPQMIPR